MMSVQLQGEDQNHLPDKFSEDVANFAPEAVCGEGELIVSEFE